MTLAMPRSGERFIQFSKSVEVHDLSVQLDVLHLLDLGTSQAFAGSIVKELLYYDNDRQCGNELGQVLGTGLESQFHWRHL